MIGASLLFYIVLVLAHFALRPLVGGPAPVDFLTIAVIVFALRNRAALAAVVGTIAGLGSDAVLAGDFGAGALAYCMLGFAVSMMKGLFIDEDIRLSALFVFLGKWAFDVLFVVTSTGELGRSKVTDVLVWSPMAAVFTAFVAVLLQPVLQRLDGSGPVRRRISR